ncbi:MAG: methylated-DNA--[protein]-cysteine S-methyltransferase [Saprospiraceae bacterium]|nr:methylated-DNA--[protein]-cysteine S-methyltransferase [Saprospiraceae bacterium]
MNTQEDLNYERIAKAIAYLITHHKSQPQLEEVAAHVHLSPFHFQRLFVEWAGISPKKFLQYLSLEHAKGMLQTQQATLFDTTYHTGLSSTSRLHDLFLSIEGMTPAEYKNGGQHLRIQYSFAESPFGHVLVASTGKGVCHLGFVEDEEKALTTLTRRFPAANFVHLLDGIQQQALAFFKGDWTQLQALKLHLKGTAFQIKVWEALLTIEMGKLSTYGKIAQQIGHPKAARAVGSAVGDNPVAFLIPCHRVIQASGVIGQYYWGSTRKTAMIGWEAAHVEIRG